MDRLLKPLRVKRPKGLSGTKPRSLLKTQIPIRTHRWDETQPGFMEADTVAHCGNSLAGDFIWSLTMTDVATGKVICPTLGDTRTEDDFVTHIRATVSTDPYAKWVFVADQLNTHKSSSLVECVAELCGVKEALAEKGKSGILEDMASRAAFLQCPDYRIRFVFTPKHCSWLNQVEIWFGILSRRLLKRGSFSSTEVLNQRIMAFIEFLNETLAKNRFDGLISENLCLSRLSDVFQKLGTSAFIDTFQPKPSLHKKI